MKPEELLQTLRDAGMDDEAIKGLLSDTLASLEGPAEEEMPAEEAPVAETEDEKMNRVFGL